MTTINFRQLIDLAIGTPEPGHVNFYALHCLLFSFAEELNIIDKNVDCTKFGNISMMQLIEKSPSTIKMEEMALKTEEMRAEDTKIELKSDIKVRSEKSEPIDTLDEAEAAELADAESKTIKKEIKKKEFKEEGTSSMAKMTDSAIMKGLCIMKEQLDLTMEQLQNLTSIYLDSEDDVHKINRLQRQAGRLRSVQQANEFIETIGLARDSELSGSWVGLEEMEEEHVVSLNDEDVDVVSQPSIRESVRDSAASYVPDQLDLDVHVSYPPEKLLDQLLQLKSEFCLLTNKVNEISATILEQDCQRTTMILQELQDQMREVKYFTASLKDMQDAMESRQNQSTDNIDSIYTTLHEIMEEKIDRGEIEILLADKVDYKQLQRKVSTEQIEEMKCELEKQFCELQRMIDQKDASVKMMIDNLRMTLGYDSIDQLMQKMKEKIDQDLQHLADTLQKYVESTNDECAAAGARIKVLQDLACLSCDTTCVMRTMEKAKVPKMANAHATAILSPLITYELGSIRKSGMMGYYRKDEFPHAPNAWMSRQNVSMKSCVPRHAGGAHTTSTAKERVEKVLLNKK